MILFCSQRYPWLSHSFCMALATFLVSSVVGTVAAESPVVSPVVLRVAGAGGSGAHEWGRFLTKTDFERVRLVTARTDSVVAELDDGVWNVQGLIDDRNRLRVPKGSFRLGDTKGINAWIAKLRTGGSLDGTGEAAGPIAGRVAFGMSPADLVAMHKSLEPTLRGATKGKLCRDVIQEIDRLLSAQLQIPADARLSIPRDAKVGDELSGLSGGTALAAICRPLGLVVVPESRGGIQTLTVRRFKDAKEHWPVGWPASEAFHHHIPKLHEFLKVEVDETPLNETVAALQARLEVPVLYDQNGMARQGIEPAEVNVSFPLKRTFYSRILKNVLGQAKLKYEVRVDEVGNPFLWISPLRKVK